VTYYDLLQLLRGSTQDDWLADDGKGIFTLKTDLDVTIRAACLDWELREPFGEEWATKFPNRQAYREIYELWFRSSFVKSYGFVSVDGGRALLPFPKAIDDMTITQEQLAVANALNSEDRSYYSRYIQRFKIEG
jgi:hypothetical protein